MIIRLATALVAATVAAHAQPVASTYATRDGRVGAVVIVCPSSDGSYIAGACAFARPANVSYAPPAASAIATANVAVTVFASGSVSTGCDLVNTGSAILYLDFTGPAAAGSPTAIPMQPGQSFHCPYAPSAAVSAVAAQPQSFVAVRY